MMFANSRVLSLRHARRPVVVGSALLAAALTLPGQVAAVAQAGAATTRVSMSGTGAEANGHSFGPAISADGRYIAFSSNASNLVPDDTNGGSSAGNDVFVRDMLAGTVRRVSVSGTGAQTDAGSTSQGAAISADGRYVAFGSDASNLVSGDTNATSDVFLRDMRAGVTRRVSVSGSGAQADDQSAWPAVSADGRYVAFGSDASNLVSGDTNATSDVFLRDMRAGVTRRVSVSGTGEQGNHAGGEDAGSHTPTISADGRYVSFVSFASNLVPADTNGRTDVFLRDWRAGVTRRISYSGAGAQADGDSSFNSISPDGRYVAFSSAASNLVPADTNAHVDVFVRDWVAGTTRRISVSGTGAQGNDDSPYGTISSGGRYVAFRSSASNLIPGDTNGCADIFVRVTG